MELTASFVELLQDFAPVFTTPTFQTFLEIVTGWILSHRHRYVTEVIFAAATLAMGIGVGSIASSARPPGTSTSWVCSWLNWSEQFWLPVPLCSGPSMIPSAANGD